MERGGIREDTIENHLIALKWQEQGNYQESVNLQNGPYLLIEKIQMN